MSFLGETKNSSTSFSKASIHTSIHAKVSRLGWTVVASQGHQKLFSSLVLTETSFFPLSRTTLSIDVASDSPASLRPEQHSAQFGPSSEQQIRHRETGALPQQQMLCRAALCCRRPTPLPHYRATHESPEQAGGEGWLVSAEQQKVVQFKPDASNVHAQWVAVRTYSWIPPSPPVPQTRRRMLRHNAIKAWNTMLKTGWRRCQPPVR